MKRMIMNVHNFTHLSVLILIVFVFYYLSFIGIFQLSEIFAQYADSESKNTTTMVQELTDQGFDLSRLDDYRGAIEYYDKALAIDPQAYFTLIFKGIALEQLGNYTGAIEYYDKALAIDPNDASNLHSKGNVLSELGNYTGAIEYYDKALAIDPNDITTVNYAFIVLSKGTALEQLGNYTGAIEYYDKALAIDPIVGTSSKENALSVLNLLHEVKLRVGTDDIGKLAGKSTPYDINIASYLVRDPEANTPNFGIEGQNVNYTIDNRAKIYIDFNRNESNGDLYNLVSSTKNLVQVSDSRIGVDISFGIPVSPKNTMESIERINGVYDVKYKDSQPNYTRFIALSQSPIIINNTNYSDLVVEFKQFNNGTGNLYIDGHRE